MSDQTMVSYTDLSNILSTVHATSAAVQRLQSQTSYLQESVKTVNSNLSVVNDNVRQLAARFTQMILEQRKQAALQRAITEIIRVRQELEQNFGQYKTVRDNMMGLLKATDAKLVRTETITRISEELILATPNYWLAPLLVAVAAWIGNDQGLAQRAIAEAVKRDEEKTALAMALICRRNGRNKTSFEWLAVYFSKQSANNMKRSIVTYIDACVSGVFGNDEDDIFSDYIRKWMSELQESNDNFKEEQVSMWSEYYNSFCVGSANQFGYLSQMAAGDFRRIDECWQRVSASYSIKEQIHSMITAPVDKEALRNKIDEELLNLIQKYDEDEAPLREEEARLTLIKELKGDEEAADTIIKRRQIAQSDEKVSLAQRLADVLKTGTQENAAAKKTAFLFLAEYIKDGFNRFINEKKVAFPNSITINSDGWSKQISGGADKLTAQRSYEEFMEERKREELKTVKPGAVITFGIFSLIGLILAIVGFAGDKAGLGVIGIIMILVFGILTIVKAAKNSGKKKEIIMRYEKMTANGKDNVGKAVEQWEFVKHNVEGFYSQPNYSVLPVKEGE